jgi:hypothetical protein
MRRRRKVMIVVAALAVLGVAAAVFLPPLVSEERRAKALARRLSGTDEKATKRARAELVAMGGEAAHAVVEELRDAMRSVPRRDWSWAWLRERIYRTRRGNWWVECKITLESMGEPAVPALERALGDRDSSVQWWAVQTLSGIKGRAADEAWARALTNLSEEVRRQAALQRGFAGDARAVPVLIPDLQSEDARRRWTAALLLQIIGTKEALAPLEDMAARFRTDEIAANYREGILAGDEEDVPLLVFCLERYGTDEMAGDYSRSQHPELGHAAEAWTQRHGKKLPEARAGAPALVWDAGQDGDPGRSE